MSITAIALKELHELHRRIGTVREQIERGPRQLEARRAHLAKSSEALDKARAELKAMKVQAHQKETQRLAMENRIRELQLKINTAQSNKEYAALVAERDSHKMAMGVLEDEILETLLREDEKKKEVEAHESEVKRAQEELARMDQQVGSRGTELAAELAALESRLETAERSLPGDMKDVYRRVVRSRAADALARVDQGTCQGCYTGITPQMHDNLLMSELVVCKSCGRILYLEEIPLPQKSE